MSELLRLPSADDGAATKAWGSGLCGSWDFAFLEGQVWVSSSGILVQVSLVSDRWDMDESEREVRTLQCGARR